MEKTAEIESGYYWVSFYGMNPHIWEYSGKVWNPIGVAPNDIELDEGYKIVGKVEQYAKATKGVSNEPNKREIEKAADIATGRSLNPDLREKQIQQRVGFRKAVDWMIKRNNPSSPEQ
jgi:hypothetical protein